MRKSRPVTVARIIKVLTVLLMSIMLAACGGDNASGPVEKGAFTVTLDKYIANLNDVIKNNSDLNPLSVDDAKDASGAMSVNAYYDGKPIGFYLINYNDKGKINSVVSTVDSNVAAGEQYEAMMTASFMAIDKSLSYEDAHEIAKTVGKDAILGGNGAEKNGIKYGCIGSADYTSWAAYPAEKSQE